MRNLKCLSIATVALFGFSGAVLADTLTIKVETTSGEGSLRGAVFDSQKSFDTDKTVAGVSKVAADELTVLEIKDLKPGSYGIALFHDKNGNEKMDRNILGAPNEPFGFSNNPKIGFSVPKFEDFEFEFDGTPAILNITLNGGLGWIAAHLQKCLQGY